MKKVLLVGLFLGILFMFGTLTGVQLMSEEQGKSEVVPLLIEEEIEEERVDKMKEIKEKKEKVDAIGTFNFFSDLGKFVADAFYEISRNVLKEMMLFVHHVLNGEPKK